MADLVSYGNAERDMEQAIISLKKGTQLIKYSRKGKPKFRAFRLAPDEKSLIWLSHGVEKNVKLSAITRIIPGQRTVSPLLLDLALTIRESGANTHRSAKGRQYPLLPVAVFRRYLRPEKDYLSFSLLYNNGDRSLDLICKDKVEAELWLGGLKALIGRNRDRRTKSDFFDISENGDTFQNGRPSGPVLESSSSLTKGRVSIDLVSQYALVNPRSSDVGSEHPNMQLRTSNVDGFRISVSSTPSCSSGGSGPDDIESLGDVYVWGEIWNDVVSSDGSVTSIPIKNDVLIPRSLESNVVLDVQQIACGVRHLALVTRQGEVFTWGEESGGRLGHGIERDFSRPKLVEFLAVTNIDFVACGENHTCAVSTSGDLFSWGDGVNNAGILGHGTDVSHWIPKRVSGPLEGLQVLSVACGTWHSALATTNGKLFTFGDGTFGVLGHGDRESLSYPREVHSLNGLKTIRVACGVWHTAAIVEVMGQTLGNISSRKLFTWGDGHKQRLGHGSKDAYLLPTCVSSLIDYNFQQIACGNTMTVALTTSGHVFTMGGIEHGQRGNPTADGNAPCLVQDKLVGEFVEEISCGAFHVVVLTSRSEVFTWGKNSNGQLGHGDTEDRRTPTLVEAFKDKHVKNISCGANFTSTICIHKWVSGADQSVCSSCHQAFGFTRKRHNCYNCGMVHCHACSSKKALRAALAPTPGKPHRVCDACYAKLKAAEAGNYANANRKVNTPHRSVDVSSRIDAGEFRSSRILLSPTTEPVKYLEIRSGRGTRSENHPLIIRASQVPSLTQLKDVAFPSSLSALQSTWKPCPSPMPQPIVSSHQHGANSRPASPYARRPSPPRSSTPGFSRSVIDSLKKTNEILQQDMRKMQIQIKSYKDKFDAQNTEIHKLNDQMKEATDLVATESSRSKEAKRLVKSIVDQLKEVAEHLPSDVLESESFKDMNTQIEAFTQADESSESDNLPTSSESYQQNAPDSTSSIHEPANNQTQRVGDHVGAITATDSYHDDGNKSSDSKTKEGELIHHSSGNESRRMHSIKREGDKENIEQFEPGVYVTFIQRSNGTKIFKRVKFSKRKFQEQQAEIWWKGNKDRLLKRYIPLVASTSSSFSSTSSPSSSSLPVVESSSSSITAPQTTTTDPPTSSSTPADTPVESPSAQDAEAALNNED